MSCGQVGWAGHWRGTNATEETVICPLSYEIRKPLEQMCALGMSLTPLDDQIVSGLTLIFLQATPLPVARPLITLLPTSSTACGMYLLSPTIKSPICEFLALDQPVCFAYSNLLCTYSADSYIECLELATTAPMDAPYNTHTLQYFAARA